MNLEKELFHLRRNFMDKFFIGCLNCGLLEEKEDSFPKNSRGFSINIIGEELIEFACKNCGSSIVSHYEK